MWTAYSEDSPIIFYEVKSPESYHLLAKYLARHEEWEVSFSWVPRRFYAYQRELSRQGLNWLMYQETNEGWKLAAHAHTNAATLPSSTRFVPTYS
jgi:hypothetical protein